MEASGTSAAGGVAYFFEVEAGSSRAKSARLLFGSRGRMWIAFRVNLGLLCRGLSSGARVGRGHGRRKCSGHCRCVRFGHGYKRSGRAPLGGSSAFSHVAPLLDAWGSSMYPQAPPPHVNWGDVPICEPHPKSSKRRSSGLTIRWRAARAELQDDQFGFAFRGAQSEDRHRFKQQPRDKRETTGVGSSSHGVLHAAGAVVSSGEDGSHGEHFRGRRRRSHDFGAFGGIQGH